MIRHWGISSPCTCQWSLVNSTTIDPPHIVKINPNCPRHGYDPDEEYERKRDDALYFEQNFNPNDGD
jgi:hypothetical protein